MLQQQCCRRILDRKEVGCHSVPMVHTAVLVDLRQVESDQLAYDPALVADYPGPRDDIIVFALSARLAGVDLQVCNDHYYGVVPVPGEEGGTLDTEQELLNQVIDSFGNSET